MTLRSLGDLWEGYLVTFGLKGDREVRWEQIEACMGYREIEIVQTNLLTTMAMKWRRKICGGWRECEIGEKKF